MKLDTVSVEEVVLATERRLHWIVIDCERNLQQKQRTLYKKNIVGAHLTIHPHIKIGCTPVRRT